MGYSNNKWRKILTILMIINLCFILFAKFSKIFASTDISISFSINGVNYSNSIPTSFNNKTGLNHVVIRTNSIATVFYVLVSENPVTFTSNNNYSTLRTSNVSTNNWVYKFNAISSSNFNNYDFSNYQGASSYTYDISFESKDLTNYPFVYSNYDVYVNNEIIFNDSSTKYPEIANSISDLESLNFDVISINAWDWSNKDFDILFYDRNNVDTSTTDGLYPKRVITVNKNTSYYQESLSANPDKNAIFWIPIEETGLNFYIGGNYEIRLAERETLNPPVYRCNLYL